MKISLWTVSLFFIWMIFPTKAISTNINYQAKTKLHACQMLTPDSIRASIDSLRVDISQQHTSDSLLLVQSQKQELQQMRKILNAPVSFISLFQIVLGTLLSICFIIWMEFVRQPNLRLSIPPQVDLHYNQNYPAQRIRSLRLSISNKNLPLLLRWLMRMPAQKCHGTISFYDSVGKNIFNRSMEIRWIRSPEPVPIQGFVGVQKLTIIDPIRLTPELNWDIYPGMEELFDVVARFDTDEECFGWSNQSYFSNPIWRNPNWRIPSGKYFIKVEIFSSGRLCAGTFRLINDLSIDDCRLEKIKADDPVI